MTKRVIITSLIIFLALDMELFSYDIEVLYYNRPPYYYSTPIGPKGIIMDKVLDIFKKAGIKAKYTLSTSNRIYLEFLSGRAKICSPGWFKNKEREKFAKFSIPIYQDSPVVLLTKRDNYKLRDYTAIQDIFKHKSFIWGRIRFFSYGYYVDSLAQKLKPKSIEIDGNQEDLITMLKYGRLHYMLINPQEIDQLIRSTGYKKNEFMVVRLNDVSTGNRRYIMFSKDISNKLIDKINKIILKYYKLN